MSREAPGSHLGSYDGLCWAMLVASWDLSWAMRRLLEASWGSWQEYIEKKSVDNSSRASEAKRSKAERSAAERSAAERSGAKRSGAKRSGAERRGGERRNIR